MKQPFKTITEDVVSHDMARTLNHLGFDGSCRHSIDSHGREYENKIHGTNKGLSKIGRVAMPIKSVVQRWLREKHGIQIEIGVYFDKDDAVSYDWTLYTFLKQDKFWQRKDDLAVFTTYELALEAGLQEGLKLITNA